MNFDGGANLNKYILELPTIDNVSETLLSYVSVSARFSLSTVFGWEHLYAISFFTVFFPILVSVLC